MENDASPPSNTNTTTATSTPPREETIKTTLHLENQNFSTDFTFLYHSIFLAKITIIDHHHHLDLPDEQPFHMFLLHPLRTASTKLDWSSNTKNSTTTMISAELASSIFFLRLSLSATRTLSSASLMLSFSTFSHPKPHSTISFSSLYPTKAIVKKSFFFVFSFYRESFELEMTFLCICWTVWLARKWEKIEKKRKYFFIWIFNIIANVNMLMWNFLIPRMETRESGKGKPRKCWGFHFNDILVILIIG